MSYLRVSSADAPAKTSQHYRQKPLYRVPNLHGFWSALWKNIGLKGISIIWRLRASHDDQEHPKPVLQSDVIVAWARCSIHLLPLACTFVLAYLNIAGLYIGQNLEGFQGKYAMSTKILGLQAAAKLLELLVVASLAQVVLDVFRKEFMFGSDGVPLGLIGAHLQFSELSYFWSPEFWSGMKGFSSMRKKIFLVLLLFVCGVITVTVGPAAALLLVPIQRDVWPAGSANLWLAGAPDSLWPETLDNSTISPSCRDNSPFQQTSQFIGTSGCAWNGYESFVSLYRQTHQEQLMNLTISDGMVTRILQSFSGKVPDPYTLAPGLAAASPSYELTENWQDAIEKIKGTSSQAHFKRHGAGTVIRLTGFIPTVRASCNMYGNFSFPNNGTWQYPYLPRSGAPSEGSYNLQQGQVIDSTSIATVWRALPNGPSPLTNGSATDYYPSAFLDMQIPHGGNFTPFGWAYSCSIDGRWIRKDTVGPHFDDNALGTYYVYGEDDYADMDLFPYAAESIPASGSVKMTLDWLNNLTPAIDANNKGATTLADILNAARMDAPTTDQLPLKNYTESIIATIVADGMSRVGYPINGGNLTLADFHKRFIEGGTGSNYNLSAFNFKSMVFNENGAQLPLPNGYEADNATSIRWSVSIAGYSYRADSVASWLSLMVLFVHSLIALTHTAWMVHERQSSGSWHSLAELLVLLQNSEPAAELRNTCAGIDRGNTFSTTAKICVVRDKEDTMTASGREQMQMLFGEARQRIPTEKVEVNTAYGST